MTALTVAPTTSLRPVGWHRLAWVTWRRYRFTFLASLLVVGLLAADLIHSGLQLRTAYGQVIACSPKGSASCRFLADQFQNTYGNGGFLAPLLLFLPGILGAFAGAPIIARELESGTFRYAWTQGVGRMRWTASLLVPGALGVALLSGALGALVNWRQRPLVAYGITSRLEPSWFPATCLAAAGWGLLGFALGALAGVLWRRVVPALASAFAVWFGIAFLVATQLRAHYRTPLRTTSLDLPRHALLVEQWWTKGGVRVSDTQINRILEQYGAQVSGHSVTVHVGPGGVDPFQALVQQGYTQVTTYQPDSRYWSFQWIELGWLVALSLVLLATTFWLVRRRTA
jgi:ABC-type transport system involved in multi-copper enzyme maturation permease subunit